MANGNCLVRPSHHHLVPTTMTHQGAHRGINRANLDVLKEVRENCRWPQKSADSQSVPKEQRRRRAENPSSKA